MKYATTLALACSLALSSAECLAADQSAADRTTAVRLATEGQHALIKKDYDTAADRFERANDLVPAPTFVARLARARVGQGRLVEAFDLYRRIVTEGVDESKPAFRAAFEEAKKALGPLEKRLASVSVTVHGPLPAGARVTLNGVEVPPAALGLWRPVDPGQVVARVEAPGYKSDESKPIVLAEGQRGPAIQLSLTELPKPAVATRHVPGENMTMDGGDSPGTSTQEVLGYVALGLGAASLVGWAISGPLSLSRHAKLLKECDARPGGNCVIYVDARGSDEEQEAREKVLRMREDYRSAARWAEYTSIGAAVLATTGIVLLLSAPDDPAADRGAFSVQPFVGLGTIGASGHF